MLDQEIELRAVAQHAEDDLRGQPGVARIERRGALEQQVGGIAAGFHLAEDVEGGDAGGGRHGDHRHDAGRFSKNPSPRKTLSGKTLFPSSP